MRPVVDRNVVMRRIPVPDYVKLETRRGEFEGIVTLINIQMQ
jgi:hypothetical protein